MIRQRPGFTLLELLVTIGIIAIIAATSIPSYAAAQRRLTVNQASNEMAGFVQAARTKAMTTGANISVTVGASTVTQTNQTTSVTTTWTPPNGLILTTSLSNFKFARLTGLTLNSDDEPISTNVEITVQSSKTVSVAPNGKISLP